MREVSVDVLRDEMLRFPFLALQTSVWHPSGLRLLSPGDVLSPPHARFMKEVGIRTLSFQEPGEGPPLVAQETDTAGARDYLQQAPPQAPRPRWAEDGLPLAFLMLPRARVRVLLRDDATRKKVVEILVSRGHEAVESRTAADLLGGLNERPDLIVADLADARTVAEAARALPLLWGTALVAATEPGRVPQVYAAMNAGATGSLQLPPTADTVLQALHGGLSAFGRLPRMKPALRTERRRETREPGNIACRICDKFLNRPLKVSSATLLDVSERGLRIEYSKPDGDAPWAYVPHSVHPRHFWYPYARVNPIGRELAIDVTPPGGKSFTVQASFLHVSGEGVFEKAGLLIRKSPGSLREQMTTVRRQPTAKTAVARGKPF